MKRSNSHLIRDLKADVDMQRTKRLELIATLIDLRRSPIARNEVEQRVDLILASEETKARNAFIPEGMSRQDGGDYATDGNVLALPTTSLIGSLVVFGFRDTIRAALLKEATVGMSGRSFSKEERRAEVARITHEIELAERIEESLIREIENEGFEILRREDARPEIILLETI